LCCPLWTPAVLIVAHPLTAHRFAHGSGHERRIQRNIIRTQSAVAAGAFSIKDPNALFRHAEHLCDLPPRIERTLGARPYGAAVALHAGGCAGRTHHAVQREWPGIAVVNSLRRLSVY